MQHYFLIIDESGRCLSTHGAELTFENVAGDPCVWRREGDDLIAAAGDIKLPIREDRPQIPGMPVEDIGELRIDIGPTMLPSEHLAEMQQDGFTVLDNILTLEMTQRLRSAALARLPADAEEMDARVGVGNGLAWSYEVAHAVTHPVALWLMQAYLDTEDIHFCHPPAITVMRPSSEFIGTFPELGWHSDYPYHPGVVEQSRWQDDDVLGVQFNICVDEFRADNGATQYLPGSYLRRAWPTEAFNTGGTRMGQGIHKDVVQMTAPAGSALIYDSRTWHRACTELNLSGSDRVAILNAVTPSWVLPMTDKEPATAAYRAGDVANLLTSRESADIDRLCNAPMQPAPAGAPVIRRREKTS